MTLLDKIRRERLNPAILEGIAEVIKNNECLFEYKDPTGHYCFAPDKYYCPLRHYPGLEIDPANCKAEELRKELYEVK